MPTVSAVPPCAQSTIASQIEAGIAHLWACQATAPSVPWSERPRLNWDERSRVNAARNTALYEAEHDPGRDGAGLSVEEVAEWVRQAEADAIARVMDDRERDEDEEARPTYEDVVDISDIAEAAYLGFSLVMEGEDPNPPAGWTMDRLVAFFDGVQAAWREREGDHREDFESWLDSLAEPEPDWDAMYPDAVDHHPCEVVEAVGVIVARNGGVR